MSEGISGNPDMWEMERRGQVKLGRDGKSPVPDERKDTINGAAVDDPSHEFVIKKNHAPN